MLLLRAPCARRLEIVPGDFLQRQEAVALGAVVDEAGFEDGLDARDPALVDVGLLLFAGRDVDVEVVELLAIDHGDAQLFLLSCIDEHSFHLPLTDGKGRRMQPVSACALAGCEPMKLRSRASSGSRR